MNLKNAAAAAALVLTTIFAGTAQSTVEKNVEKNRQPALPPNLDPKGFKDAVLTGCSQDGKVVTMSLLIQKDLESYFQTAFHNAAPQMSAQDFVQKKEGKDAFLKELENAVKGSKYETGNDVIFLSLNVPVIHDKKCTP